MRLLQPSLQTQHASRQPAGLAAASGPPSGLCEFPQCLGRHSQPHPGQHCMACPHCKRGKGEALRGQVGEGHEMHAAACEHCRAVAVEQRRSHAPGGQHMGVQWCFGQLLHNAGCQRRCFSGRTRHLSCLSPSCIQWDIALSDKHGGDWHTVLGHIISTAMRCSSCVD
jgi:hypothetical protein